MKRDARQKHRDPEGNATPSCELVRVLPPVPGGKPIVLLGFFVAPMGRIEAASVSQVLIIGYGNVLREDDGAGYRAGEQLQQYYRDHPGIAVIASHQLLPEMAPDIAQSGLVIFLDATSAEEPGQISQNRIQSQAGDAGFTHQLTPAALLSLAATLYGHAPEAVAITLAGWSFNISDKLSRRAEMLLPVLIRQAKDVVEHYRRHVPSDNNLVLL